MTIDGLDVYSGTGGIEWYRVAQAGKGFAFVRGAYGDHADRMVKQNFAGAKAEGLVCGVYHFYRQPLDADAQIRIICSVIDQIQLRTGDLPPVIDIEDNPAYDGAWDTANNPDYLADVQRWLATLQQKTGRPPIIYVRAGFWSTLGNPTGFQDYPLWIANYGVPEPKLPAGWATYNFWQFTETGSVDGIAGECDLDVFKGSQDDLDNLTLP